MKNAKNNKILMNDEDFGVITLLIESLLFYIPGMLFSINENNNCDFLCGLVKSFFYSMLFLIFGMIINYLLLKFFTPLKKFLFSLIDGEKKKVALFFVLGSFYSYISLFIILIFLFTMKILIFFYKEIIKLGE